MEDKSKLNIGGNVKVTVKRKNTTVKSVTINNTATLQMLYGIARYIRGDFINYSDYSTSYLPFFLNVGTVGAVEGDPNHALTNLRDEVDSSYTKRFKAIGNQIRIEDNKVILEISSFVSSGVLTNVQIKELGLFYSKAVGVNSLLARVTVEDPIILNKSQSLQVDWEIILGTN